MRKIAEYIRLIFVSFEFLYSLAVSALANFFPAPLCALGSVLKANNDIIKWIPVLPLGICGFVFSLAWRITAPSSGSNRELYQWPDYWRLTCRRDFSIVLSVLVAMLAVSLWIFSAHLSDLMFGYIFSLALGVALIDMGCLAFAGFKIKEITEL